jgi:hypothetical protein
LWCLTSIFSHICVEVVYRLRIGLRSEHGVVSAAEVCRAKISKPAGLFRHAQSRHKLQKRKQLGSCVRKSKQRNIDTTSTQLRHKNRHTDFETAYCIWSAATYDHLADKQVHHISRTRTDKSTLVLAFCVFYIRDLLRVVR